MSFVIGICLVFFVSDYVQGGVPPSVILEVVPVLAQGLRAIVVFVVLMGVFYGFVHTPTSADATFQPYLSLLAQIIGKGLKLIGYDVAVADTTILYPQFSMRIVRGCDAIEPTAIFAAAVLASPVPGWWMKAPLGILIGAAGLFVINIVRLTSLFYIGIHYRTWFDLLHEQVWQMAFIVLALAFWAVWVQWATKEPASSKVKVHVQAQPDRITII